MDIKLRSIEQIGLSPRASNALRRARVHTVGDLLAYDKEKLSAIRNMGKKSIEEILLKIEEYTKYATGGPVPDRESNLKGSDVADNFNAWLRETVGREYVIAWLEERNVGIDALELLSARTYNLLELAGHVGLHEIAFLSEEELLQVPRIDEQLAGEIRELCDRYLEDHAKEILESYTAALAAAQTPAVTLYDMLKMPEYRNPIRQYACANDREIEQLRLSRRPKRLLLESGYTRISDIIFLTRQELLNIPSMGANSAEEIVTEINKYLEEHEVRLTAFCGGNESVLLDDVAIRGMILGLYRDVGFGGLSLNDIVERLQRPKQITQERLKKLVGGLIAEHELEYVDFYCYRIYGKFAEQVDRCPDIDERSRAIIRGKLQGLPLDALGGEYGLSRERVRQIIDREAGKVRKWYVASSGKSWFDEDYFRYFYSTYDIERKDGSDWLGIPSHVFFYLEMMDVKRGQEDLERALKDPKLDAGLRLKIRNYINHNKIFVDGMWVEKRRVDLEKVVVRKFCADEVSFEEFVQRYNGFLEQEGVPYDEDIYYTEAILRTRKNHLSRAPYLLWKQNEQFRYYDIDGRDFTELLDVLNLDAYKNVEFSTEKFMKEYPEIMEKYDIRDRYELHNLLRKIVPEGSYHDFRCVRMPGIRFGTFDRDAAIWDILIDNAPISATDLCALLHDEYGYDPATVQANYLQAFSPYYHQGVYTIEQKVMSPENRKTLMEALSDDFYYIKEIRTIYKGLLPKADLEEVNPYNLKAMGFTIRSHYVFRNHASAEEFFESLLKRDDSTDITEYRRRFGKIASFSQKIMELKRSLEIVEFEPNQIITIRKLEEAGVTKDMLRDFCDAVYDFVEDGVYFSATSLRQDGFESELYGLGSSDVFYANLLIADKRFSFASVYGSLILCKGKVDITIRSFLSDRIKSHGIIDIYDLMSELTDRFGCKNMDKADLTYKAQGTGIYYDKTLERLYADADTFYRDLDVTEEI